MALRLILLLFISLPATAQLHFTSSKMQKIAVYKGSIIVNGNRTYQVQPDAIVYKSKRNKIVEDNGNVFLFLDIDKNKIYVFGINNSVADSLMEAVSSDVKDYDHDGEMEFGGPGAVIPHPSADSIYYTPATFYEIKKGRIVVDQEYTEKMEKKINKVYIKGAKPYLSILKPSGSKPLN
jgi:hypothetical protein